nr:HNH endonuclease [Streptomyces sp. DSM 41633]
CQNPGHWLIGDRLQNIVDFQARRGLTGHALADVRGAAGRAVAVRDAILAAAPGEEPAVIAAAIAAGHPSGDRQDTLW